MKLFSKISVLALNIFDPSLKTHHEILFTCLIVSKIINNKDVIQEFICNAICISNGLMAEIFSAKSRNQEFKVPVQFLQTLNFFRSIFYPMNIMQCLKTCLI